MPLRGGRVTQICAGGRARFHLDAPSEADRHASMRRLVVVGMLGCGGPDLLVNATALECGAGTVEQNGVCEPVVITCGAGTHEHDGACVRDPSIQILASNIRADGWTRPLIRVLATGPDGLPAHERVILTSDRASAGTIVSPVFALEDRGGGSTFVPCNAQTDANCLGDVRISVAREAAPQSPIAQVDLTVEAPPPIGSTAPCLGGGNVFHVDGSDYWVNGPTTYSTGATFDVFGANDRARMQLVLGNTSWIWEMNTRRIGIPLLLSVYENAKGIGETPAGEPTMFLSASGTPTAGACAARHSFQVHEFEYSAATDQITLLTATFTSTCDSFPTRTLSGCVHFTQ